MLQTSLLLMKSLNKTETPISDLWCVLCFQRQSFGAEFQTTFVVSFVFFFFFFFFF